MFLALVDLPPEPVFQRLVGKQKPRFIPMAAWRCLAAFGFLDGAPDALFAALPLTLGPAFFAEIGRNFLPTGPAGKRRFDRLINGYQAFIFVVIRSLVGFSFPQHIRTANSNPATQILERATRPEQFHIMSDGFVLEVSRDWDMKRELLKTATSF